MDIKFFKKENLMCVLATLIIVLSYGAQRIIEVSVSGGKTLGLILAMVYTALLAISLLLISKSNNSFFGILAALIGYKMMPPTIDFLDATSFWLFTSFINLRKSLTKSGRFPCWLYC